MRKVAFFLILALAVAIGCSATDAEGEISKLLDERARAIASKDIELYKKCLARDYQKPAELMKQHFDFWDAIEMRVLDRSIELQSDGSAVVYQKYQFRVKKNGEWQVLEPAVEKLVLKKEGGLFKRWKIAGGLLPDEESGSEPD